MRYYHVIILLAFLFHGCKIQKHVEMDKLEVADNKVEVVETNDRNTVRFITITKYQTIRDTITNDYPIESVTTIEERNNDKVITKTNAESHTEEQETVTEDKKTDTSISTYIWCVIAGAFGMLIIVVLVKIIIWYIKKKN